MTTTIAFTTITDCRTHVDDLAAAATAANVRLGALVEIECGQNRGGCAPASQTALDLARAIGASSVSAEA